VRKEYFCRAWLFVRYLSEILFILFPLFFILILEELSCRIIP
jgi:hypothetical protein